MSLLGRHGPGCYESLLEKFNGRQSNGTLPENEGNFRLSKAELFFRNFKTMGVAPNLETFNILMKIACKKQQFDKCRDLINYVWRRNLRPDVYSYGTLINGLAKSGGLNQALEVFDEMLDREVMPDVTSSMPKPLTYGLPSYPSTDFYRIPRFELLTFS
ncbi:pentatricopeptide repeat-containing protein At3g09060-like [Olea europaea var. sylvestris]|uniref:pentatricopeptide repeat-containing protein At3g09060-like n=1 Tax=Olea europaea var. sylvestris TaxID=158386 RepID=UPI000C1D76DB|nr:pentatricopeptide repeat-containing protein At3g09060-like [Olea europaea var. sylvestris]